MKAAIGGTHFLYCPYWNTKYLKDMFILASHGGNTPIVKLETDNTGFTIDPW